MSARVPANVDRGSARHVSAGHPAVYLMRPRCKESCGSRAGAFHSFSTDGRSAGSEDSAGTAREARLGPDEYVEAGQVFLVPPRRRSRGRGGPGVKSSSFRLDTPGVGRVRTGYQQLPAAGDEYPAPDPRHEQHLHVHRSGLLGGRNPGDRLEPATCPRVRLRGGGQRPKGTSCGRTRASASCGEVANPSASRGS